MEVSGASEAPPLWVEPLVKRLKGQGIIFLSEIPHFSKLLTLINPPSNVDKRAILAMELDAKPFWQTLSRCNELHPFATRFILLSDERLSLLDNRDFSDRIVKGLCISPDLQVSPDVINRFLAHRMDLETLRVTISDNSSVNALATCPNLKKLTISVLHTSPWPIVEYLINKCPKLAKVTLEGSGLSEVATSQLNAAAASLLDSRCSPQPILECVSFRRDILDSAFISILKNTSPAVHTFSFENCSNITDISLRQLAKHIRDNDVLLRRINLVGTNISSIASGEFLWRRANLEDLKIEVHSNAHPVCMAIGTCVDLRTLTLKIHTKDACECVFQILQKCQRLTSLSLQGSKHEFSDREIESLARVNPGLNIILP
ncbi:MAG: hypothetical protein Q8K75_03710 [Chlamydiales bacterium]|nr:hypothetical protein [Chlamydiales bacterium]